MMRGDGFQCDIPDPVTENLLRAMLKTGEQASGRSKKRMSMQPGTLDLVVDAPWTGPTTTTLEQCEQPNRWRYGDRGTAKNPERKGCPNEPLCCRDADAANPEDGCNCSGMPLPNSRRQGVYKVIIDRLNFGQRYFGDFFDLRK